MCEQYNIALTHQKMKGVYGQGMIAGEKVLLVKPMTYMNNSGECVGALARFYKLEPTDIIVIYDDINLAVGHLRIRKKGSAGGHNGIKSLIAHLGSEEFPRIRIGVGENVGGKDLIQHVLGHFPEEQLEAMAEAMDDAVKAAELMVAGDVQQAMNRYNGKRQSH
jgi:PTH1 family peptidyl-tRNA hydrolase